ncbi:hypothetical protein SALBM135S_00573 [Streptomyces alboniger]
MREESIVGEEPSAVKAPARPAVPVPSAVKAPARPAVPVPAIEEADVFRAGDIVTIQGRPGERKLMEPAAPRTWTVQPARPEHRDREAAPASGLRPVPDAPQVRRGDLAMQYHPEQERGGIVGHVYRLGRWVCEKTVTDADGTTWQRTDEVDTLVVLTSEQAARAVRLDIAHGPHRGRIVQAVVSQRARQFRVGCSCLNDSTHEEVCGTGRKVGWCTSLHPARAQWQWHAGGEAKPAPADAETPAPPAAVVVQQSAEPDDAPPAGRQDPAAPQPRYLCAEEYLQQEQANSLGWSTRHAEAVGWAADRQLHLDAAGVLRRVTRPGRPGRRVTGALLQLLTGAAFLTVAPADDQGRQIVRATADGLRALLVWDRKHPAQAEMSRPHEHRALAPLFQGQEAACRVAQFRAGMGTPPGGTGGLVCRLRPAPGSRRARGAAAQGVGEGRAHHQPLRPPPGRLDTHSRAGNGTRNRRRAPGRAGGRGSPTGRRDRHGDGQGPAHGPTPAGTQTSSCRLLSVVA